MVSRRDDTRILPRAVFFLDQKFTKCRGCAATRPLTSKRSRCVAARSIVPAMPQGLRGQAGTAWGQLWGQLPGAVRALDLNINDLEALLDRLPATICSSKDIPRKAGILDKTRAPAFFVSAQPHSTLAIPGH